MTATIVIEPVCKFIHVKVPIEHAFETFTTGLTRWWPAKCGVGNRPIQKVVLEPRLGGRWVEFAEDGTQTVVATISHWEPPHRLVLVWQVNAQWKPDAEMKSEVDVRFTPDGADATHVELVHHKFETMGFEGGASMRKDVDGGWMGLLEKFALESESSKNT